MSAIGLGVGKKQIRAVLIGTPGVIIAAGSFFAIWDGPRAWMGGIATELVAALAHPLLTMTLTLLAVGYISALAWTYVEPRPAPVDHRAQREADQAKEIDMRRLAMIREARALVARHEADEHSDWRGTIRTSPEYLALRPHLSAKYLKRVSAVRTIEIGIDTMHEPLVGGFLDEIDRLEKEWGLA